jgi:hypothetical protein
MGKTGWRPAKWKRPLGVRRVGAAFKANGGTSHFFAVFGGGKILPGFKTPSSHLAQAADGC